MSNKEIPYFEDEESKLRPEFPIVERETINAILWDPTKNQVLCLDWQKFGWKTFVIGGVDKGEDALAAATREIQEETGYKNLQLVADLGKLRSGYFAAHKNENRIANTTGLLFKIIDSTQDIVKNAETLPHVFHWIPKQEVETYLTLSSQKYLWTQAQKHV